MRYLLVEKPQGLQPRERLRVHFRAPTCDELFQSLRDYRNSRSVRESGCSYQYKGERFELVDTFDEPGLIYDDAYWTYWEPASDSAPSPRDATRR